MDELLTNPVFQAAVIPFIAALVAGLILNRLGSHGVGVIIVIGFLFCAWLIVDFKLSPLTSTRKIILLGAIAAFTGVVLDIYPLSRRYIPYILFTTGAIAALWIIWPVLVRKEAGEFWFMATGSCIYAGWMMVSMDRLRIMPIRAGSAALALGVGTGLSAVMGASALLGQLGSSVAAASGAYLLLALFFPNQSAGSALTIPVAMLSGLLGIAANVYATLPWYTLPLLAIIPLLACIPLPEHKPLLLKMVLLVLATMPAAIGAIIITWGVEGAPPI